MASGKLGGISESKGVDNSLEIESLAKFAVDEHNKKQNTLLKFEKVVSSKQQVVEGMMYYITVEVLDGDQKKTYEAKVWVKPWMNFKELESFEPVGVDNSLEIESLAKFAVDEHNKKQNTLLQFEKVVSSKEQVVEGMMYYITVEVLDGDQKKTYEAKVWVKPWMNFKKLESFIDQSKMASGKFGGITESEGVDNSLEIESLAKFAVDEHNKKQNTLLQFEKVVSSKQQVVAGTMYYITVEVLDGDQKKTYEAKVWVKPWMNFKELESFEPVDATASA